MSAVICEPLRSAVGRFGGALRDVSAHELGAQVVRALVARTGLPSDEVDDVLFGHCYPTSEAPALGRVVALDAGLPTTVPGMQIDRRCGSSLQALLLAVAMVESGQATTIIAGGTESMSRVPYYSSAMRWGAKSGETVLHDALTRGRSTPGGRFYPVPGGMIETAENLRAEYAIGRAEQDEYAERSHARAVAAQASGVFDDEIVPIEVPAGSAFAVDEHPRQGVTVESLARLTPLMADVDPLATVTAGNSSGQNDAASACLVTTEANAKRLGLRPFARLASWAVAGVPPRTMGIGPLPATALALKRAGLGLQDVGLIELNEAFAVQVLAVLREWDVSADDPRLNVHGSGISLGHPVGATGTRILATLLREMRRREVRFGLETLCIGGGQGISAVFEGL